MNTKEMTWRQFMKTKFLHSSEIAKGGQNVTIVDFIYKEAFSKEAGKKEELPSMVIKEYDKPIGMSNRKASQITQLFGDNLKDAIGKTVFLYGKNEKWFGVWDDVLTFKSAEEIKKEALNSKHAKWKGACDAIKSGKSTVEAIEKHYTLTEAVKTSLTKLIHEKDENKTN